MIQTPFLQDEDFLADIVAHQDACRLWWLGQSGFLLQYGSQRLLLDPYLSDSLTRKYATTDKPHDRMTGRVVAPESLDGVHVAVSTHNHSDHLDRETLLPLRRANPDLSLIIPEANRDFVARRLECEADWPLGLVDGGNITIGAFTFTGIASAHELLLTNSLGQHHYLGYIVQFGRWTLYHPGDTMLYEGLVERLAPFDIDMALLPINGRDPRRRVAGNMDGAEAAQLAKDIGAGVVVPCHYDMFEFNTATPELFRRTAELLGQPFRILRNGEGMTLN